MERGLRLTGAEVLGPAGIAAADVILRAGRFSAQIDAQDHNLRLDGLWLLPGIVDLHGDGFERHLAPRRGMVSDLGHSLRPVEAELAQNGITTAWAAQFWSWEGGMRGPAFATRFAKALSGACDWLRLDLRMQLRVEAHMIEDGDAIRELVSAHGIDYLVINDHLPHR
ncbi:MAG: alpha-D-ribose 1-methylphosphonate 5-triphosphate diphosphatase, partial [Mangrovicoccus sp.]|nr:alpha-D-ribose 1-methylphosphonate 5-triphosphate diphosphatase [Mangrovicoccus sp.]